MQQEKNLQTQNSGNSSTQLIQVNKLSELSVRASSFIELWQSKEPSFALIKKDYGFKVTKALLFIEISKMKHIISAEIDKVHIEYLANYILKHFHYFKISDLTIITERLVKNNPYGKPILQNIIHEIDKYNSDRDMYAQEYNQKRSQEHKTDAELENVDMQKIYQKLKQKAKVPEMSQKEKDEMARERLKKQMEKFNKIYK